MIGGKKEISEANYGNNNILDEISANDGSNDLVCSLRKLSSNWNWI